MVYVKIVLYTLAVIFVYRLFRYLSTPFFRKIGLYRYYSPMFLVMPFFNNTLDIHLGTSWDFLNHRGQNPKNIMIHLVDGLINLSKDIQSGHIKVDTILRGNTHFLKSGSLHRFGFETRKLNIFEWILFALNYFELCFLYSLSTQRLTYVPIENVRIVTCLAGDIIKNLPKMNAMKIRLQKKTAIYNHPVDLGKVA